MNELGMKFYEQRSVELGKGGGRQCSLNRLREKIELTTEQIVELSRGIFKEPQRVKCLRPCRANFCFQCWKAALLLEYTHVQVFTC